MKATLPFTTHLLHTKVNDFLQVADYKCGEPGGARTRDHRIKSAMLYQLSYRPKLFNHKDFLGNFWLNTLFFVRYLSAMHGFRNTGQYYTPDRALSES